jgi:hypothetical protein
MKKACITVREQMDREADQEDIVENANDLYDGIVGGKKTKEDEASSPLEKFFMRILVGKGEGAGGVREACTQDLLKFMGKEKHMLKAQYQQLCFNILSSTTDARVVDKLCKGGLFDHLHQWLKHDLEIKYHKVVKQMLIMLAKLAVSEDFLLGEGKAFVMALKGLKAYKEDEGVMKGSKIVLRKWKEIASGKSKEVKKEAPATTTAAATANAPTTPAAAAPKKPKTIMMNDSMHDPLDQAPAKKKVKPAPRPRQQALPPTEASKPSSSSKADEPVVVKTVRMQGRTVAGSKSDIKANVSLGGGNKTSSNKVLAPSEMKPKGKKGRRITWKDEVFKDAPLCEFRFIESVKSKAKQAADQQAQRLEEREREKQENLKMKQINEEIRTEQKKKKRKEVEQERKKLAETMPSKQWNAPMPVKVWWQLSGDLEKEVESTEYGTQSERQTKSSPYKCRDPARDFPRDAKGMIMTTPSEPPRPQITANIQNHLKSMLANQALLKNISQIQSLGDVGGGGGGGGGQVVAQNRQPNHHQSSTFYAPTPPPAAMGNQIVMSPHPQQGPPGGFRMQQQQQPPVHSFPMQMNQQQPPRQLAPPMNMGNLGMPINTQYVTHQQPPPGMLGGMPHTGPPGGNLGMQNQFGGSRPRYNSNINGSHYNNNNSNGRSNQSNRRVCSYFNTPKVSS